MKKTITALAILFALVGYSAWNRIQSRRVRIPSSNLYVHIPLGVKPRLWGNAVEFDHHGWAEICWTPDGKHVQCNPLKQASPQ